MILFLPPANEVCEGYVFTGVCDSVNGGGMRGFTGGHLVLFGGCAWFYLGGVRGFMGGVHGFIRGACMVLFGGACMVLFGGACMVLFGGACVVLFGGHAWFYSGGMHGFIRGGVHGFIRGACMVLFGGHAWFYSGGMQYLGGCAWFFQFFRIQWDTVNERAVRILLECILVCIVFDFYVFYKLIYNHFVHNVVICRR